MHKCEKCMSKHLTYFYSTEIIKDDKGEEIIVYVYKCINCGKVEVLNPVDNARIPMNGKFGEEL